MKCQILFSQKNKKNIFMCHLLKILPRVLSVKYCLALTFAVHTCSNGKLSYGVAQVYYTCVYQPKSVNSKIYDQCTQTIYRYSYNKCIISVIQNTIFNIITAYVPTKFMHCQAISNSLEYCHIYFSITINVWVLIWQVEMIQMRTHNICVYT